MVVRTLAIQYRLHNIKVCCLEWRQVRCKVLGKNYDFDGIVTRHFQQRFVSGIQKSNKEFSVIHNCPKSCCILSTFTDGV